MKDFLKSRTIQAALISAIAIIFTTVLVLHYKEDPGIEIKMDNETPKISSNTEVFHFVPSPMLNTEDNLEYADCWTRSLASDREDAFRCMVGNLIYDPCFVNSFSKNKLVCPDHPPEESFNFNVEINESKIGDIHKRDNQFPWQITLNTGEVCRFITGASSSVLGKRMSYRCSNGDNSVNYLLLPIYDDTPYSKIDCFIDEYVGQCDIKEVWY